MGKANGQAAKLEGSIVAVPLLDGTFSFSRVVELLRAELQKAGAATRK